MNLFYERFFSLFFFSKQSPTGIEFSLSWDNENTSSGFCLFIFTAHTNTLGKLRQQQRANKSQKQHSRSKSKHATAHREHILSGRWSKAPSRLRGVSSCITTATEQREAPSGLHVTSISICVDLSLNVHIFTTLLKPQLWIDHRSIPIYVSSSITQRQIDESCSSLLELGRLSIRMST
jgi:hypothetical protein